MITSIKKWISKLLKQLPKKSLRDKVVEMYGEEFRELYDKVNQGIPIGGFVETCIFLDMVERARNSLKEE